VIEPFLERQRNARGGVLIVVRQDETPVPRLLVLGRWALGQDVEFDHVHPVRERGVEALERVARLDQVRSLVADASHLRE
jgi:hypothetical protein